MKYHIISLLFICGLLSAENLYFFRNTYPVEYFQHSRERASLFFEDGTLQGSYHYLTPKGNLLYSGDLSKNDEFTQRDMLHKVSYASTQDKYSYAFTLGYGLEKENRNQKWYDDHTVIDQTENAIHMGASFRRSLSYKKALLLSLHGISEIIKGESIFFRAKGDDYTIWDINYHNYNSPNIDLSTAINVGHINYAHSKQGTPFIWLTDLVWDLRIQRVGDQVNLNLVEAYENNPAIDKIYFTRTNNIYQSWRLRTAILGAKRNSQFIAPLKGAISEKYGNLNLHEISIQLSQHRRDADYEKIVYAYLNEHLKSSNTWHSTKVMVTTNIDITLFTYFFLGAKSFTEFSWDHDLSDPYLSFYISIHPEVGFRASLSDKLFLTITKEISSLYISDFYWEFYPWGDDKLEEFPLTISLSYTF